MCRESSYIKELQSKPNQPTFSFESKVTLALLLGGASGGAENNEAPAEKPAIQTREDTGNCLSQLFGKLKRLVKGF
jgi:hypothetical protein